MKIKSISLLLVTPILTILLASTTAFAQPIALPNDLPPGAISYGNVSSGNFATDPNVIAAVIGVAGLLIGSIITILATYFMRWMDVRRENRREKFLFERDRKEKIFQLKQEVYKNFLNELSSLETFQQSDIDTFNKELIKTDIKLDLVASKQVREANEALKDMLYGIAEKNYKSKSISLTPEYLEQREELLTEMRKDIDLMNNK